MNYCSLVLIRASQVVIGRSYVRLLFEELGFFSNYTCDSVKKITSCLFIPWLSLPTRTSFFVSLFLSSNRVFTEGTCKLLNLIISDLVDEDFVLHSRKQAISALIFGTSALFSKPGQTLAPLIGTWLLAEQTGHSLFYSDDLWASPANRRTSFHDSANDALRWGCFYVLVYVPIVCAFLQIFVWMRFKLHGSRLRWVKQMREGRWFYSSEV